MPIILKKKNLIILFLLGAFGIAIGVLISPDVVERYISSAGPMTSRGFEVLSYYRIIAIFAGAVFIFISLGNRIISDATLSRYAPHTFRVTFATLIIIWAILFGIFSLSRVFHISDDIPTYFPISKFRLEASLSGCFYAIPFSLILIWVFKQYKNFTKTHFWSAAFALLIAGNLMQGSVTEALLDPFTIGDKQYYHQALMINNAVEWLSHYNALQTGMLTHSRTHPAFATLVHYFLLNCESGNPSWLSISFVIVSGLTIPLIYNIMREIGVAQLNSGLFSVLLAVMPAFNIYGVVSIDGVIATTVCMCLFGSILITNRGLTTAGLVALGIGLTIVNLLTFAGTFIIALIFILGVKDAFLYKNYGMLASWLVSVMFLTIILVGSYLFLSYNHAEAFLTASSLENPDGFLLIADPIRYILTRVECVSEILFMLSFGVLSLFFSREMLCLKIFDIRNRNTCIPLAGGSVLLLMFLSGAYKTGETARACLFIYPFIIILLRKVERRYLLMLIALCGIQTMIMQMFGAYFW